MTAVIRHRLTYILLLGIVTSGLSVAALWRALSLSEAQRLERAREAVQGELELLARTPTGGQTAAVPRATYVGLRGGKVAGVEDVARIEGLPEPWAQVLRRAVAAAASTDRVLLDEALAGGRLVIGCARVADGYLWTAVQQAPSAALRPWRQIAFGIAAATALLVATSVASVLSFRRQTRALTGTLRALGKDLQAPVARPNLAELAGVADGIEGLARDLVASREATDRLLRELAQKERLAALGRVVAGVAHEVRNPLAAIKLRLDLTAQAAALPDETRAAIGAASREIARLDRLVSDLLIVAGKQPGPRRAIAVGDLVRARVETLQPWAEARGVALRAEGGATAEADPESIARAIDNLLRNAVEASPRGEVVIARVGAVDGDVEVHIEDAGGGIEPARAAELFEPFFTTKPDGTGLGLALSRAIARTHGGEVSYARAGGRTRFSMSLPRRAEATS